MPKDQTPSTRPDSAPETANPPAGADPAQDGAGPTPPDAKAREVIARALALKKQGGGARGGPPSRSTAAHGPRRNDFTPAPIRPGGRGRRG